MVPQNWLWRGLGPVLCRDWKHSCSRWVIFQPAGITLCYPLRCVHCLIKERVVVHGGAVGVEQYPGLIVTVWVDNCGFCATLFRELKAAAAMACPVQVP